LLIHTHTHTRVFGVPYHLPHPALLCSDHNLLRGAQPQVRRGLRQGQQDKVARAGMYACIGSRTRFIYLVYLHRTSYTRYMYIYIYNMRRGLRQGEQDKFSRAGLYIYTRFTYLVYLHGILYTRYIYICVYTCIICAEVDAKANKTKSLEQACIYI